MGSALPEDGTLVTCEVDERAAEIAQEHFDMAPYGAQLTLK